MSAEAEEGREYSVPTDWPENVQSVVDEFDGDDQALACAVHDLRVKNRELRRRLRSEPSGEVVAEGWVSEKNVREYDEDGAFAAITVSGNRWARFGDDMRVVLVRRSSGEGEDG